MSPLQRIANQAVTAPRLDALSLPPGTRYSSNGWRRRGIGLPMQSESNRSVDRFAVSPPACVHVVDDDAALRRSLNRLLRSAGYETALYASAAAFLKVALELPAGGCLLLDLKLPGMGGLDLQQQLTLLGVLIPTIVMTAQSGVNTVVRAMKGGAVDFIEKPFESDRLLDAIERALTAKGGPQLNRKVIEAAKRIAALSPREHAVLDGLVEGLSNKQIAHILGISVRTVEAHRARMLDRLEAHGLAEAVRLAVLAMLAAL